MNAGIAGISVITVVLGSAAPVLAAESSWIRFAPLLLIGAVVVGVAFAFLLSRLAETKGDRGNGTNRAESMGKNSRASGKKAAATARELEDKYQKIIDDRDKEIKIISHEHDLTLKKCEKIESEKKQVESIVSSIADGLIVVNNKGEIQFLNPAAKELIGADVENVVGKNILENAGDEQLVSMFRDSSGGREKDIEFGGGDDTRRTIRENNSTAPSSTRSLPCFLREMRVRWWSFLDYTRTYFQME